MCALALGVMSCSETAGTGGSGGDGGMGGDGGGGTPECQGPEDCDDATDCTDDTCADGECESTPVVDGTACDESNDCTTGMCADGECDTAPVQDGNPCGGETFWGDPRGGCYDGSCNFVPVSVAVGEKEVVFDWSRDRCEDYDLPDGPAKVVRAEDGELVLFANNEPRYRVSRGPDFDTLQHVCDPPALVSADLPTPESYENNEWLWSPYRVGAEWHVLIHNEFHDATSINCSPSYLCWYNSITYAVSTDGGHSFVKPSPPAHVVAPAPRVWTPPDTPIEDWHAEGYFAPTNIVHGPGDFYYTLLAATPRQGQPRGTCAIRTNTLHDPASWRAWDGTGFNLPLTSPYVSGEEAQPCEFVVPEDDFGDTASLTYNTYLERYMWVGMHLSWETGESVCGVYFSTSFDLVHWSDIQLIAKGLSWCETDPTTPGLLEPVQIQYPSIIDHEDSTANFERPGQTPYLYSTRFNEGFWLDRDLVRVPLTFTLEE
jgi:hypothetical protein